MGCFLSCFRDSGRGLHDPLVPGSRFGDAFLDDDEVDTRKLGARGEPNEDSGNNGGVDDDLRRQVNYLKSCGAILEIPPEFLKVSSQISAEESKSNGMSKDAQPNIGTVTFEDKDNFSKGLSCDGHDTWKLDQNIDEGAEHATGVEPVPTSSSQSKYSCQNIRNQKLDSSDSPFPTPLVLRGDIQTPGTIYTAKQGSFKSGKRGRTVRQFIYPVLRPIENKLPWAEPRDDPSPLVSSNPPKRRYLSADCTDKPQQAFPSSLAANIFPFHANDAEQYERVTSPKKPKDQNSSQQQSDCASGASGDHGVASLSYWLKTSSGDGQNQSDAEGTAGTQPCYQRSVFTDAPIFVASGLDWDNDNPTPQLPKTWDGNGIPNTTTKYKEDQKVSWHATPFEERLLRVLSDEKPHHQRNISGKLIQLEEDAE